MAGISSIQPNPVQDYSIHRIIWCNYLPDSSDVTTSTTLASDSSKVFILTRKNQADIFHLDLIKETYGTDLPVPINSSDIKQGHLTIKEHATNILTATFSPDGSAVATSSYDGALHFFKIAFSSKNLKYIIILQVIKLIPRKTFITI
jgi:enhancer of mRNA-decapping protein 4